MKNKFILLAFGLFIISCSNDDNNTTTEITEEVIVGEGDNTPPADEDFLLDTNGDFWVYDTQSTQGNGRDSLYIANDTVITGTTYKKYKTGQPATGLYSSMLTTGAVKKNDGKMMLTGALNLDNEMGIPFNLNITDFIVFDKNATAEQVLSTQQGTINQDMQGVALTVNYILTTRAKQEIAAYTVAGTTYTNVKPVEMRLNLQVVVSFNGFPFVLMPAQDVLVSIQYYDLTRGAINIASDLQYELTDVSGFGIDLPIPQTLNLQQQEILVNHNIQ